MTSMLVSFLESLKYTGHLFPLTFLRVFLGYFYLNEALLKYQGEFLIKPFLAEIIRHGLKVNPHAPWYLNMMETLVLPHWEIAAMAIVVSYFIIGFSYLLGFLVRPVSILAFLISLNYLGLTAGDSAAFYKTLVAVNLTLGWLGAGRCLGLDYYYFKRHRGVWW